jgi:hypothetical protein
VSLEQFQEVPSSVAGKIYDYSVVVVTKDQVSADLSGEAAILNLKSGIYYGLNEAGARIWKLIQEPRTVNEIKDTLLQEFDVEPDQCETDLFALLEELLSKGLIEVKDEKGP